MGEVAAEAAEAAGGGAAADEGKEQARPDFRLGDLVEVFGLTSESGRLLNAKRGPIERVRRDTGRFEIYLGEKPMSLKPENLRLVGDSVRLGPLRLRRGDGCEVRGLTSEAGRALNGEAVLVRGWEAATSRYNVSLAAQGSSTKALRAENLARIPELDLASPEAAAGALRALRGAYRRPEARRAWRQLLGKAAAAPEELEATALRVQRPALEGLGLRPDSVGRGHLHAALASFGSDAAFCRELAACPENDRGHGGSRPASTDLTSVVFMDIDGVLHSLQGDDLFRESCCALLERILHASGAQVILSSTWRLERSKQDMVDSVLRGRQLPIVHDITKDLCTNREEEVGEWLDRHPETTCWVAIDDMDLQSRTSPFAVRMRGHFVRTDQSRGLQPEDAELAVALLAAQRSEHGALVAARRLAASGQGLGALRWAGTGFGTGAGAGAGAGAPSPAEREQLERLCQACLEASAQEGLVAQEASTSQRPLAEVAESCGVAPEVVRALAQAHLPSVAALAALSAPGNFETGVLRLWFDPGDFGGERALLEEEKASLKKLYEACRAEAGLPPGPYAKASAAGPVRQGPRTLREHADGLCIPLALREAFLDSLCEFETAEGDKTQA